MHSIEHLESRIAPAIMTPSVVKGVLMLQHDAASGTGENLVVTQTGTDTFTVVDMLPDPDTNFGAFTGVKSISVKFGSDGSTLDIAVSTTGLSGAVNVSATGGVNTYVLRTADGESGRIGGKVTVEGGVDEDTLLFQDGISTAAPVTFHGGTGADTFRPRDAYLAKKLTLESVEEITVQDIEPVVIGGLLVENEDANAPVIFSLSNVATILGKLTYCGSETVVDNVSIAGQVTGSALLMLFGGENNVTVSGQFASSLKITGTGGDDTVTFTTTSVNLAPPVPPDVDPGPFVTANITGPLTMLLGDGTNTVTAEQNAYFAKGFSLTTGAGADTVNFDKFIAAKNVTLKLGNGTNMLTGTTDFGSHNYITGALKYTGGIDADTLDINHLIAGTLSVKLNNGANAITGEGRITGKSASITGGTGVETLNFGLVSTAAKLTVKLNSGDDVFTFLGGTLGSVLFDGSTGADTLNGIALLPAKSTIKSFETQT